MDDLKYRYKIFTNCGFWNKCAFGGYGNSWLITIIVGWDEILLVMTTDNNGAKDEDDNLTVHTYTYDFDLKVMWDPCTQCVQWLQSTHTH